ncbi:MAG TPA: ABC transporter permease [Candidatus Limnocylindrales bacterium]|nr:ABC transporter permease [Candidatus Limnocylindrales bacterium]
MTNSVPARDDPAFPNISIIARREYRELVRGRLFKVSTLILITLVLLIAILPIGVRVFQRGQTTQVAVVAADSVLANRTIDHLRTFLPQGDRPYELIAMRDPAASIEQVNDRNLDAALEVERQPSGRLSFTVHLGETLGQTALADLGFATFATAIIDFSERNPVVGFEVPDFNVVRGSSSAGRGSAFDPAVFASRLIVGAVFGFLIFLSIVIYGMWVAQGVVAEKQSRVMELLISAASARQLVVGKAVGIGLAGATQTLLVLVPALAVLAVEDILAKVVLGQGVGIDSSLKALSPGLLLGFASYYVLGFALYAFVYAAAGSLLSRAEDLQIVALPLAIIAIVGYFQAILALTGGITAFIRLASYVPFWSPFVMITRLAVGRVEPWEIALSLGLLGATIVIVGVIAIRIYAAGVLLYGQRPGLRAYVAAARGR